MHMNTQDIGTKLVALCNAGKDGEAQATLYAADAVSVEAGAQPGMDREVKGLAAIKAKGEWWYGQHEVHSVKATGPFPHDDRFVVIFDMDVTNKTMGQRFQMQEAALYTVANGKIVREEFFYSMG
jgi:ketosteroid isomerase-like protein